MTSPLNIPWSTPFSAYPPTAEVPLLELGVVNESTEVLSQATAYWRFTAPTDGVMMLDASHSTHIDGSQGDDLEVYGYAGYDSEWGWDSAWEDENVSYVYKAIGAVTYDLDEQWQTGYTEVLYVNMTAGQTMVFAFDYGGHSQGVLGVRMHVEARFGVWSEWVAPEKTEIFKIIPIQYGPGGIREQPLGLDGGQIPAYYLEVDDLNNMDARYSGWPFGTSDLYANTSMSKLGISQYALSADRVAAMWDTLQRLPDEYTYWPEPNPFPTQPEFYTPSSDVQDLLAQSVAFGEGNASASMSWYGTGMALNVHELEYLITAGIKNKTTGEDNYFGDIQGQEIFEGMEGVIAVEHEYRDPLSKAFYLGNQDGRGHLHMMRETYVIEGLKVGIGRKFPQESDDYDAPHTFNLYQMPWKLDRHINAESVGLTWRTTPSPNSGFWLDRAYSIADMLTPDPLIAPPAQPLMAWPGTEPAWIDSIDLEGVVDGETEYMTVNPSGLYFDRSGFHGLVISAFPESVLTHEYPFTHDHGETAYNNFSVGQDMGWALQVTMTAQPYRLLLDYTGAETTISNKLLDTRRRFARAKTS